MMLPRLVGAVCVVAVLASSTGVHAQPARDAKTLIKEAKALLKQKKLAEACDKLAEAEEAQPAASTEVLLADCREKTGKPATAWQLWTKAGEAKDKKTAAEAKRRAKKLEPKLSYLTIDVPAERRVFGLEVLRDDAVLDAQTWSTRVPLDPGAYTISARAPGHVAWTQSITIDAKQRDQTVEMPALDEVRKVAPPVVVVTRHVRGGRRYKAATIVLSVAGLGGVGLGIAMGLRVRSLSADSNAICPHTACLDPEGLDLNKRARSAATLSNVGFVAGGAVLLGAGVLWWLGRPSVRPVVERQQVGFVVGGSW